MKIIDVSLDIETGMPTCGTPWHQKVEIERLGRIDSVGRNTSRIVLGSHSGTHMDAPLHFIDSSNDISKLDINLLCGEISVIDFSNFGQGDVVNLEDVKKIEVTERMLFRFDWFKKWKTNDFYKSFPYFSKEAVVYLYESGMRLMALDTPSPDDGSAINSTGDDDSPNHKYLLKNNVIIVEYLCNTDKIDLNLKHEIIALPLKIVGSDGSPSRVIIREE